MTGAKNGCFKRYLGYLFETTLLRNIATAVLSVLLLNDNLQFLGPRNIGLHSVSWVMVLLGTVMPILTFANMNNKRRLDSLYALPISRRDLIFANYLWGMISMAVIYTAVYCVYLCKLFTVMKLYNINIGWVLLFYPISLIYGIVIYTFFSFIFTKANTTADGVVFCIFWSFILGLILFGVSFFIHDRWDISGRYADCLLCGVIQLPLNCAVSNIYDLIFEKGYAMYDLERLCFWIGMPFWTMISALCGIAFFRTFPKKAAEKAGDISSSIFGYKFLIPASVLSLMAVSYRNVITTAMLSIFMIVGYIVYRRGIKFRKSDLLFIAIGIIIAAGSAFN